MGQISGVIKLFWMEEKLKYAKISGMQLTQWLKWNFITSYLRKDLKSTIYASILRN